MTVYGVYRDRARSAVLVTIVLDPKLAKRQANGLASQYHASYCVVESDGVSALPDVLRYGQRYGPRVIERWSYQRYRP